MFEVITSLRYNVFGTTNLLSRKEVNQLSLHSNSSQLYFDFVYSDYFNKHSEFKYLLYLINQIDWSSASEFDNPMIGRTGYSRRSLLKALFVQKVKIALFVPFSTIRRAMVSLNIVMSIITLHLMLIWS